MAKTPGRSKRTSNPARAGAKQPAKSPPKVSGWKAKPSDTALTFGSGAERASWIMLRILVFLVPITISNFVWTGISQLPFTFDQFDEPKVLVQRIFTLLALAAWGWALLTVGGKMRRTKFDWLIVVFLAWVLLASILSIHPATAFFGKYRRLEGFFSFVNYAAVFFLTVQLVDKPGKMRALIKTLFFSNMLVVVYGLMQNWGLDPVKWGSLPFELTRPFSTYGNPDLLGGFLMFSLPTALALALSEDNEYWRIAYWLGFGLTVYVWIVASVRGAWIGGAVALAILIFAAVWQRMRVTLVDWVFMSLTAAAGLVLVVYSSLKGTGVMNVGQRLASIFQFGEGSAKSRFEIWQAAINAIKSRPVFGFGPDTFRLVFPMFKPAAYTADAGYLSVADNVHNYALQLTAGIGIPGALMFYGLFGWGLVSSAKHAFDRDAGPKRLLYAGVWAAVIGYLVHLFTGLSVTGSTVFLWLFLGVLAAPLARSVEFKAPKWGQIGALILAAACVIGAVYWMWWGSADYFYLQGKITGTDANPQYAQRIVDLQTAIYRNPFNDMYRSELPTVHQQAFSALAAQAQQEQQQGKNPQQTVAAAKQEFALAEQGFIDTIRFVPYEYDNYVFLTNLYDFGGSFFGDKSYFAKGVEVGNRGIKLEPFGPAIKLQTSAAYSGLGQYAEAKKLLVAAARLDPAYLEPHLALADTYVRAGQPLVAVHLLKGALVQFKGFPAPSPGATTPEQEIQQALDGVRSAIASSTPSPKAPSKK